MGEAKAVAAHDLERGAAAAAVTSVCMADVDVAKVAQPNWRACRIRPSSHLFYDCIRN